MKYLKALIIVGVISLLGGSALVYNKLRVVKPPCAGVSLREPVGVLKIRFPTRLLGAGGGVSSSIIYLQKSENGFYESAPETTVPEGKYLVKHLEKWGGRDVPELIGYQVVFTDNLGNTRGEAPQGFEDFSFDWKAPVVQIITTTEL